MYATDYRNIAPNARIHMYLLHWHGYLHLYLNLVV